jgi:hypothetical protein
MSEVGGSREVFLEAAQKLAEEGDALRAAGKDTLRPGQSFQLRRKLVELDRALSDEEPGPMQDAIMFVRAYLDAQSLAPDNPKRKELEQFADWTPRRFVALAEYLPVTAQRLLAGRGRPPDDKIAFQVMLTRRHMWQSGERSATVAARAVLTAVGLSPALEAIRLAIGDAGWEATTDNDKTKLKGRADDIAKRIGQQHARRVQRRQMMQQLRVRVVDLSPAEK